MVLPNDTDKPQPAKGKNRTGRQTEGCDILSSISYAPVVKLADTMDLGSIPATGRGSSPLGRTSSGIPMTAPFPPRGENCAIMEIPSPSTAIHFVGFAVDFFTGDERRETRDGRRETRDGKRGTGNEKANVKSGAQPSEEKTGASCRQFFVQRQVSGSEKRRWSIR